MTDALLTAAIVAYLVLAAAYLLVVAVHVWRNK